MYLIIYLLIINLNYDYLLSFNLIFLVRWMNPHHLIHQMTVYILLDQVGLYVIASIRMLLLNVFQLSWSYRYYNNSIRVLWTLQSIVLVLIWTGSFHQFHLILLLALELLLHIDMYHSQALSLVGISIVHLNMIWRKIHNLSLDLI